MRIDIVPFPSVHSPGQANPGTEEEVLLDSNSFFLMVTDRMKVLLCGNSYGEIKEDVIDAAIAGADLQDDPKSSPSSTEPAGILHMQDLQVYDTPVACAVAEAYLDPTLVAGGSRNTAASEDRTVGSAEVAELVGAVSVVDGTMAAVLSMAAATHLQQSGLSLSDAVESAADAARTAAPVPPQMTFLPKGSFEPVVPADAVEGTAGSQGIVKILAEVPRGGGAGQPAESFASSHVNTSHVRQAAPAHAMHREIKGIPVPRGAPPQHAMPEAPAAKQESVDLPNVKVYESAIAGKHGLNTRNTPISTAAEASRGSSPPLPSIAEFPGMILSARTVTGQAVPDFMPDQNASTGDPAILRDYHRVASQTVESARIEFQAIPFVALKDAAKWQDTDLSAPEASEAAAVVPKPDPASKACSETPMQAPRLALHHAVEPAAVVHKPDPASAAHREIPRQALQTAGQNTAEPAAIVSKPDPVMGAYREIHTQVPKTEPTIPVEPSVMLSKPDPAVETHREIHLQERCFSEREAPQAAPSSARLDLPALRSHVPSDRGSDMPAMNPAAEAPRMDVALQTSKADPAYASTSELTGMQPAAPQVKLRIEELIVDVRQVHDLPAGYSRRPDAPGAQTPGGDIMRTRILPASPPENVHAEASDSPVRQSAAPEMEIPVVQRGPFPLDVQAAYLRENPLRPRSPRSRDQESGGGVVARQLSRMDADVRRVAQMLNAGIPILPEAGKPRVGAQDSEHAFFSNLQPDDHSKSRHADLQQKPAFDSAETAQRDHHAPADPPPHAAPPRSIPRDVAIHAPLRPGQTAVFRVSTPAAGETTPAQATTAEYKALSALLAPRSSGGAPEPDFLSQLAERFQAHLREGENVLRIQLKPSSLGRVEIRAETSGSGLVATILTETAAVREYLEHNLHVLQQSFQDQGLKVDRIQVGVQEGFWHHNPSAGQQESRPHGEPRDDAGAPVWRSDSDDHARIEAVHDPSSLAVLKPHSTFHTIA